MKTTLMRTLILSTVLVMQVSAREADSVQTLQLPSEQVDQSAVQFHLLGGYSLSYKNQSSVSSATRYSLDLSLGYSNTSTDGTSSYGFPGNVNEFTRNQKGDGNNQSIGASMHFLYYNTTNPSIMPFLGFGPGIGFSRSLTIFEDSQTQTNPQGGTQRVNFTNENGSYGIGLAVIGIAGIECSVADGILLLAEYRASVSYNWGKQWFESSSLPDGGSRTSDRNEYSITSWAVTLNSIRIGVGIAM